MPFQGAGGTKGGTGRFFMGLIMMIAGGYLFFNAIRVNHFFTMGYVIYGFGSVKLTTGMVLIPLVFGIGLIFYDSDKIIGWILSIAALVMMVFGVLSSLQFSMRSMSAFELIMILILMVGGLGLFLSSLRNIESRNDNKSLPPY
jgi:hypothetical protein